MSKSGPFGPGFLGVWQSLHPPIVTRYFPRSTGDWAAALVCGELFAQPAASTRSVANETNPRKTRIVLLEKTLIMRGQLPAVKRRGIFRREYTGCVFVV